MNIMGVNMTNKINRYIIEMSKIDFYTLFLYFILLVKGLFALTMILDMFDFSDSKIFSKEFMEKNGERKERFENLYLFLMAIMLIIIFRDRSRTSIKFTGLERELLYLLGLVLAFKLFFTWYKRFKKVVLQDKSNKHTDTNVIQDTIDVTTDVFIPLS